MTQEEQPDNEEAVPVITEHGVLGYRKGCRCIVCRRDKSASVAKWRLDSGATKQRMWAGEVRPRAKHGTRSKYVAGCRCEDCTDANRVYQRSAARMKREGISMSSEWDQ
ncbi:hypothetical protein UFOVP1279_22 [uncultured Caudovirales phage]|uniref:Uncharacterized protein n=1 Tax=uncultured Caudovirales phage TaxID=2100421 RepID=A0A6J5RT47_9CAUD|nr:hypothetical protein UFOVP1279_22 [uncultured Caudovirales phage]